MTRAVSDELLLLIRMDGFITGYASAVVTMASGSTVPAEDREALADVLSDSACERIYADPILLEAQRQQIAERLAGKDSGDYTIREVGAVTGQLPPRPAYGSHGKCLCGHVDHPEHPRSSFAGTHGHTRCAESRLIYWVRPIGAAVCGPCGLAIMAEFPEEVVVL